MLPRRNFLFGGIICQRKKKKKIKLFFLLWTTCITFFIPSSIPILSLIDLVFLPFSLSLFLSNSHVSHFTLPLLTLLTSHQLPVMSTNHLRNGDAEPLLRQTLLSSSQRSIVNSTSQVAIVGVNVSPIESLDYESVFSPFFSSGCCAFAQSWNLFRDPPLKSRAFCFGCAGCLRTSSSSRIGGAEDRFRYFSTFLWNGSCAFSLAWSLALLVSATISRWRISLASSLWSPPIWCWRGGNDVLNYFVLFF